VKLAGGDIGVKSKLGAGATFYFGWEVREMSQKTPPNIDATLLPKKILIAVDNECFMSSVSKHLCELVESFVAYRDLGTNPSNYPNLAEFLGESPATLLDIEHPNALAITKICANLALEKKSEIWKLVLIGSVSKDKPNTPYTFLSTLRPLLPSNLNLVITVLSKPIRRSKLLKCLMATKTSIACNTTLSAPTLPPIVNRISVNSGVATSNPTPLTGGKENFILVVEDNKVNMKVILGQLGKLGLKSDTATNGLEAVEKVKQNHPKYSIVLMDCAMPIMDGFEATRQIRALKEPGIGKLPIIAVTASVLEGDRLQCISAGMTDVLCKPLSTAQLKAKIGEFIK